MNTFFKSAAILATIMMLTISTSMAAIAGDRVHRLALQISDNNKRFEADALKPICSPTGALVTW